MAADPTPGSSGSRENAKALEMMRQADKKMNSWFGGSGKFEEASEMFQKAGNLLKVNKSWDDAGRAYCRAADCLLRAKMTYEASQQYISAANCFRKSNPSEAANCLRQAIDMLVDEGRFAIAARHQQDIAELYEQSNDMESAIAAYEKAADFYEGDNSTSRANTCLIKVATFAAQLENYDKAIELFDKIGKGCLDSNLLKWGAKDHFMKAVLCYMAKADAVGARRALEKYQEMDVSFGSQRECKFLTQLLDAVDAYDVDAFTNAVVDFDSVTKLDPWKTTILLRIKNQIKEQDGADLT